MKSYPNQTITVKATADVVAHRFITFAGASPPAGGTVAGITRNAAKSGEAVPVDIYGVVPVEAGAVVAQGAAVMSKGNGKVVALTADKVLVGYATQAATADGDLILVKLS